MKRMLAAVFALIMSAALCGCFPAMLLRGARSSWMIDYYIDDFGAAAGGAYLCGEFEVSGGTELEDSLLTVIVYYEPELDETFSFRLIDAYNGIVTYGERDNITLLTDIGGETAEYGLYGSAPDGDMYLWDENGLAQALMVNESDIDCVITLGESNYGFTIDGNGFAERLEDILSGDNVESPTSDPESPAVDV